MIEGLTSSAMQSALARRSRFHVSASFLEVAQEFGANPNPVWLGLGTFPGVSGVTGAALRETSFINRSLAALADVLGALSEHRGHVPYRNSKLTHLLQDVLGNSVPPEGETAVPLLWGELAPPGHTSSGGFLARWVTIVPSLIFLALSLAPAHFPVLLCCPTLGLACLLGA